MRGLGSGIVRIGTLASISSNWLPRLMKEFKEMYPSVHFDLQQGEYTNISGWIRDGSVDFGFVNPDAAEGLTTVALKRDEMLAVLPVNHKMSKRNAVTLKELSKEPYILLDEGELSEPLEFSEPTDWSLIHSMLCLMITPLCRWLRRGLEYRCFQRWCLTGTIII